MKSAKGWGRLGMKCRLGDICLKITSGGTPKSTNISYYGGNIPWLRTQEVNFVDIERTEMYITQKGYDDSSAKWIPANAVIIAMYGATAGKCAISRIPLTTNQACCNLIIDNNKADYRYVYYQLKLNYEKLLGLANGGAQQNLNAKIISDYEIDLPSLNKQCTIADTLSAFDAKIADNKTVNRLLEQMAQAIFKSWFVDFEPWGGVMPEDWDNGCLDDIMELFDSKRVPLSGNQREKMEKLFPYYGAATLMDYVDDYLFDGIYLLLGEDGTVIDDFGFPILQYVWGKFWVNNHAHVIQGRNGFTVESLYCLLKQTSVASIVTGAVQPKINQANLKTIEICIPRANVMAQYNDTITPMFDRVRKNSDENRILTLLRDTLLLRLMSGELSIADLVDVK